MNHARNVVVAASADIIAVVGGRAGTLTEMGFGWTLGRPLIAISAQGWGTRLAGQALDDRREEPVYGPLGPLEAAKLCRELGENLSRARKEF
ncbi:MAG: TIGR00725 family protein, partial [Myxococcota bacterium]|nr:TIGR00725 family protein [Myxococcota bacterium]